MPEAELPVSEQADGSSIKQVNNRTFTRKAIKTHKVAIGEHLPSVIEQYAAGDQLDPSSILCLSQKLVSLCLYNVRHTSTVHPGFLARRISKRVDTTHGPGWSYPPKMQVAIETAGYPRIIAGVVIGGLTKLVLKRSGDFWRIAGHHASEIDGLNPQMMKPYDEYAILPPPQPEAICEGMAQRFGCACCILDANDINVQVVGASANLQALGVDTVLVRELTLDNPLGQDDRMTPMLILKEVR